MREPLAGHSGTIYRAANWQQDGRTDQEAQDVTDGLITASEPRRIRAAPEFQKARKSEPESPRLKFCYVYRMKGRGGVKGSQSKNTP